MPGRDSWNIRGIKTLEISKIDSRHYSRPDSKGNSQWRPLSTWKALQCLLMTHPYRCEELETDLHDLLRAMHRLFVDVDEYAELLDGWRSIQTPKGEHDPTKFMELLRASEAITGELRRRALDKDSRLETWLPEPSGRDRYIMLRRAISSQCPDEVKDLEMEHIGDYRGLERALRKVATNFKEWGESTVDQDFESEDEVLPPVDIKREEPSLGGIQPSPLTTPERNSCRSLRPANRRKSPKLEPHPELPTPMAVVPTEAHSVEQAPRTAEERYQRLMEQINAMRLRVATTEARSTADRIVQSVVQTTELPSTPKEPILQRHAFPMVSGDANAWTGRGGKEMSVAPLMVEIDTRDCGKLRAVADTRANLCATTLAWAKKLNLATQLKKPPVEIMTAGGLIYSTRVASVICKAPAVGRLFIYLFENLPYDFFVGRNTLTGLGFGPRKVRKKGKASKGSLAKRRQSEHHVDSAVRVPSPFPNSTQGDESPSASCAETNWYKKGKPPKPRAPCD